MTSYSDLEYMWDTPESRLEAHELYWSCFVSISKITAIIISIYILFSFT